MKHLCSGIVLILSVASVVSADTVKTLQGLAYEGVIQNYQNQKITILLNSSGRETVKPIEEVGFVQINGELDLNQAETSLAEKDYRAAFSAYDRALRTADGWKATLIQHRRLQGLGKSGRIDDAVESWLELADRQGIDPALKLIPTTFGSKGSNDNKKAIRALSDKADALRQTDKQNYLRAVLNLKLKIQRAEGDEQGANETAVAISNIGGTASPSAPDASAPAPAADTDVDLVSQLYKAGEYEKVITQITGKLNSYRMEQLPPILLLLGKARLQRYRETDGVNQDLLMEAGLDLMFVYAVFGGAEEAPEALYHAAEVNEHLGETAAVRAALTTLTEKYAAENSKWVDKARQKLRELDAGGQ
jgi:hypothetical protein